MDVSVVLTSAVVGAVVSSLFAVVSQFLERRARQRELLMKAATESGDEASGAGGHAYEGQRRAVLAVRTAGI